MPRKSKKKVKPKETEKSVEKEEPNTEVPKAEQTLEPADLKFRMGEGKEATNSAALRLQKDESESDGVNRLSDDGWNVKEQAYVRQGNVLKSVGKRIMGATRRLEVGKPAMIDYYDILEVKDVDSLVSTPFQKQITYQGKKDNMIYGTTESGTIMAFPIGAIANTMPLVESEDSEQTDETESASEEDA